jgi:hypothetical protein
MRVKNDESSTNVLDLFKYKSLRTTTICTGFIFLGIQAIYYSTLLNLNHIGFGKIINQ